jgi:hypothetical protein
LLATATLIVLLTATLCTGQIRDRTQHQQATGDNNQSQINAKTKKRGPRAIAVVEFLPGGGAQLVPVALWIDDRFYDASLYGANPEPMALQPETVYEATNYGEPAGLFTVTTPAEVKGSWIGNGQWKPHRALDEKLAKQAASQPKPKAPASTPLDDRPVLRRPGSSSPGSSTSGSAGGSSPAGDDASRSPEPPDRPTLKKPVSEASSAPPPPQSAPAKTASESSPSTPSADENDPNRPTLRRGAPNKTAADREPANTASPPSAGTPQAAPGPQATVMATMARVRGSSFAAISDATPFETRSLLYAMSPSERTDKSEQMNALAVSEVQKFIAKRKTPAMPKDATITNFDLRAYDLEYSNSPTLVFSGTLSVPSAKAPRGGEFDYFVTVVAREDVNGTPIEIFSVVSDSNHLDAFPRMEIIDAIDADANGRGDLLFRQYSDTTISYSLYRVYPYEMRKIFEGGSGV